MVPKSGQPSNPSWFTPKRLLIIFCVINLINYVDRGAIASNGVNGTLSTCTDSGVCTSGTGIQGEFNLSNFQDGVLSSAFMVGLLIASPIFASLAKSHNPFRLIGVGLSVWTFAVAGCGSSFDFWSIAICRMLVGVGEASFISLAAPFIDDNAPVAQKTAWLATFYMCIPAGTALGYVYGGLVGSIFNWRVAFWSEAIFMLPFPILGFLIKPLQLKGFGPTESKQTLASIEANVSENGDDDMRAEDQAFIRGSGLKSKLWSQFTRFSKDMQELLHDSVYVINVLGYIAYNFVIGAYSYWGPKAGYSIYHMVLLYLVSMFDKGDKLTVAPYGFEKTTWDPSTDYFLPENFDAENMNGKAVCKVALLQRLGLAEHSSIILVGCNFPEGADIDVKKIKDIVLNTKQHDVQFIFMETSERPILNQALESLQKELKDDDNIKFVRAYDEALSHLLFAGSDIILCQSFLDPTDETPLKALRYGAVPIAVGPEAHTNRVVPFDRNFIHHDQEATKYSKLINNTFGNMSLGLAIDEIRSNPSKWKRRIVDAMIHDLSWDGECYDIHVAAYSAIKNM